MSSFSSSAPVPPSQPSSQAAYDSVIRTCARLGRPEIAKPRMTEVQTLPVSKSEPSQRLVLDVWKAADVCSFARASNTSTSVARRLCAGHMQGESSLGLQLAAKHLWAAGLTSCTRPRQTRRAEQSENHPAGLKQTESSIARLRQREAVVGAFGSLQRDDDVAQNSRSLRKRSGPSKDLKHERDHVERCRGTHNGCDNTAKTA